MLKSCYMVLKDVKAHWEQMLDMLATEVPQVPHVSRLAVVQALF